MEIEKLLQELPPEAAKFFAFFGRFECALKKVGCLKSAEKGARAEAGWDKFAKSLGERFYGEVQESGKANLFWENPPKKQIVGRGGSLGWKSIPVKDVETLFDAVRRVRNNLFHGGKYPEPNGGVIPDPARDAKLLSQAREVLEMALKKSAKVQRAFWEF